MKAHLEQCGRLRHKCHADAVSQGRGFLVRVGCNTKIEIPCSTTDQGTTEEDGRGGCKPIAGKQSHTVCSFSECTAKLRGLELTTAQKDQTRLMDSVEGIMSQEFE